MQYWLRLKVRVATQSLRHFNHSRKWEQFRNEKKKPLSHPLSNLKKILKIKKRA